MIWLELMVVLFFIFLGAKLGNIGIGYAGGAGVVTLTLLFGLKAGALPVDVVMIIMSVIAAIAAMQKASGMDYLVYLSEKVLRKNPAHITFVAPIVTYLMTLMAGTGHTAYATLSVIAEIAKENGIRPSRPLSIAVISSQVAITASPISAAVIIFSGLLEPFGVGYLTFLAIAIPSTFLACLVGAAISSLIGKPLWEDEIYQARLKNGLVKHREVRNYLPTKEAKLSVFFFISAVIFIVIYATLVSDKVGIILNPPLTRNDSIVAIMFLAATLISLFCQINLSEITSMSTFKSGMSACVCVLGVAWLGDTFVANHIDEIKLVSGEILQRHSWLLAIILFFASMLLYSQAATTKALMPTALALGISPIAAIASFAAVSALFVLPTYPTLLAAVEMDETGSTRIGHYIFDHPFLIPGVITIFSSVLFGFIFGHFII
jgi:anaerobic C4-dicarboxylate transporter DcuA